MTSDIATLRTLLRTDLYHRLRPMSGRDPEERGRSATPVELLYDLTYVIAFAAAAEELAHGVSLGHLWPALGAYAFAIFAVTWAWMNFTWFASAYGNDDAMFRVATLVQMIGVVILIFGLPVSFEAAAHGESPNNMLMVLGYVVMRVPLIALWLRAARQDPAHRRIDTAYAVTIAIAQVAWVLSAIAGLTTVVTVAILVLLATAEMVVPIILERRLGRPPWNAGHVAERFSLLTLIVLGEVIAATTSAVTALTGEDGWSPAAVAITASGLVLATAFWWAYFREDLRRAGAHALAYSSSSAVSSGRSRTVTAIPYGRNRTLRVLSTLCLFARRASSSVAYTCSICAPPPSFTV